jgi:hypothetical protein
MFVARLLSYFGSVGALALVLATPAPATTLEGGVYPFYPGDTFVFQYKETETGYAPVSYVQTTTIEPLTTFNGFKAYPFHTIGSYKSSSGVVTVDDLEYRNFLSGGHYASYGYVYASSTAEAGGVTAHDVAQREYTTPYYYDILPETSGGSWAEPVAVSDKTDDYDVTSGKSTNVLSYTLARNADGSYKETGVDGTVAYTRVVDSNGTGYDSDKLSGGVRTWTYGLPELDKSAYVIPATETYGSTTDTVLVPDWYPSHDAPSKPLATSEAHDLGKVKPPAACAGAYSANMATHLEMIYTQLDPVYGDTYDETDDYYVVPGVGRICRLISIVETDYDKESTGRVASTEKTTSSEVLLSEKLH